MLVTQELITPLKAAAFLKLNTRNRSVSKDTVNRYANAMRSGSFKVTGDSIKISKKNILLDGQHRLHAVIQSDTEHTFVVVRGLDDDSFDCMDIGKRRSGADCLTVLNCKNASRAAGALRILALLRKKGALNIIEIRSSMGITNAEIIEIFQGEPLFEEYIRSLTSHSMRDFLYLTGTGILGLFYDRWLIDRRQIEEFFSKASSGDNLSEFHPILYLRKTLFKDSHASVKMPIGIKFWLVATIWNDYKNGRSIRKSISLPEYSSSSLIPLI